MASPCCWQCEPIGDWRYLFLDTKGSVSFGVQLAGVVWKLQVGRIQPDLVPNFVLICYLVGLSCNPINGLYCCLLDFQKSLDPIFCCFVEGTGSVTRVEGYFVSKEDLIG